MCQKLPNLPGKKERTFLKKKFAPEGKRVITLLYAKKEERGPPAEKRGIIFVWKETEERGEEGRNLHL